VTNHADRTRLDTAIGGVCRVAKVDASNGLIIGWGIICTEKGEKYYDLHGDHMPEDVMLKAAAKFMRTARAARIMHDDKDVGQVVFAMPVLTDVFKALDLAGPERTGLVIGWAPDDRAWLQKYASGELTGFSFGGWAKRKRAEVS